MARIQKKNQGKVESSDFFIPLPSAEDQPRRPKMAANPQEEKTRSENTLQREEEDVVESELPLPTPRLLSKRSLLVFRPMFPETNDERKSGIEWNSFSQAMQNARFSSRNGGGSMVIFEQDNARAKIILHRPHPKPTIDAIMLHPTGKRLKKWFGWARDTFTVAEKVS